MNQIENDQAKKAWELMLNSLQESKDFITEQIPDVIQQLIAWQRFWMTARLCLSIVIILACVLLIRWSIKKIQTIKYKPFDESELYTISIIAGVLAGIGGFAWMLNNLYYASMVWFAPKIYIIEYLSDIVRKH